MNEKIVEVGHPVFVVTDVLLGKGVVGGNVCSGKHCGRDLADIVLQIVNEKKSADMPFRIDRPELLADINIIDRFHFNEKKLPPATVKLNKKNAIWEEYPLEFSLMTTVLGLFSLLILLSVYMQKSNKRYIGELKNAMEAAQSAEKAKSHFISIMSHEIRTPLNAIIGVSELMSTKEISNQEKVEYLQSIKDAGNALLSIINDVLDLSKLGSGKIDFLMVNCDVKNIIAEISDIFRERAKTKNIDIIINVGDEIPELVLEASRLKQILLNLIGNAVKFTQKGVVKISVEFEKSSEEFGSLNISVSDTGIGMSKEFLSRIFKPFSQEDSTKGNRKYEGSGLGLSICKKLAEAVGATIDVESEVGLGSTFTYSQKNIRYSAAAKKIEDEKSETSELGDLKVLLVDDVKMNLKILEHIVNKMNLKVVSANSGKEALQLFEKDHFDILLTDIWMPEMNGQELAEILRKKSRNLKIIAITGDADVSSNFDMKAFDYILTKPVMTDKLRSAICGLNIDKN